jgi:hypothetical protein
MKAQEAYRKMVDDGTMELLGTLAARWVDEREYEDIEDYREVLQSKAPFVKVLKMSKRPFGFVFEAEDKKVHVFIKKSAAGWGYAGKVVK